MYVAIAAKRTAATADLMSLEEQVDREFAAARRRAWMRKLGRLLFGKPGAGSLLPFEAVRRTVGACGGVRRGRRTVEAARIVGSTGKNEWFDEEFMPLRDASGRGGSGSTGRSGSGSRSTSCKTATTV